MDPATRLGRHSDLWQAGSTRCERTAVAGLIFASVIFFNVVEPFAQTQQSRVDLAAFTSRQQQAEVVVARMDAFAASLEGISRAVEAADWKRHNDELMRRFRDGEVTSPQPEADQVIREIAAEVRSDVLEPLAAAVASAGLDESLAEHTTRMKTAIDTWEQAHLGQRWFQTVREKEETVFELDTTIGNLQEEARQLVVRLQREVEVERSQLHQAQATLAAEIQTTRDRIQQTLDENIPAWAKGLVSVEWMVGVYPWILVGIAIYLVGNALVSTRHYHGMADAAGWSGPERGDPLLSSMWTLTWRGAAGTAITLLSYIAVLAGLAYFLNRSIALVGSGQTPAWLLNLILLLLLLVVIAAPLRRVHAAFSYKGG